MAWGCGRGVGVLSLVVRPVRKWIGGGFIVDIVVGFIAGARLVGVGLMIRVLGLMGILSVWGGESILVRRAVCLWWVRSGRSSVLIAQGP